MNNFKKELTELIKKHGISDYRSYIIDCLDARDDAMMIPEKKKDRLTILQFIKNNPGMTGELRNKLIIFEKIGEVKYVSDINLSEFRKIRNVGPKIEGELKELLEKL